jgi:hypothetical protein
MGRTNMSSKLELKLRPVKPSEIPTRGKWKRLVLKLIDDFQKMEDPYVEVFGFRNEKEMMAIYDAFKNTIKRLGLKMDIQKKKSRLFLVKEE